jgi:sterol desaturase/sphingolipid hydroxylase (fatty acid hydroxylase superfamily)
VINFAFAFAIVATGEWASAHHFGLLYIVHLPTWAFVLAGLLLLDLISAWLIHWIEHRTRWMWQFHTIHHIDRNVDVTTANRHHPVESIFRAAFTLLAVFVTGVPIWVLMLYQSFSVLFSQFNHANIRLPHALDRALSFVIVSPDMHKVHHHFTRPYTDSNYGNIFSLWDRLFGTFLYLPPSSLRYGLDTHMSEKDSIGVLLGVPFQPYRARPSSSGSPAEG